MSKPLETLSGFPLFEWEGPTLTLGLDMNQNRMAVPVWGYAIEKYCPVRIIEIGSYNGGFTMALAFAGWTRHVSVYSYELNEAPKEEWRLLANFLKVQFLIGNCFACEHEIRQLMESPGLTYLLCDGGNKIREFNTFAKYLKPGDVIAAHDFLTDYWYCGEFSLEAVEDTVSAYKLKRWMPEMFALAGWAAFVKPTTGE